MTPKGIPDELVQFIYKYINSIELLEVLLQLQKDTNRSWELEEIAQELRTNSSSVANRLVELHSYGFLVQSEVNGKITYTYGPKEQELAKLTQLLSNFYKSHRVSIIALVFGRPKKSITSFANAFRLWEKK